MTASSAAASAASKDELATKILDNDVLVEEDIHAEERKDLVSSLPPSARATTSKAASADKASAPSTAISSPTPSVQPEHGGDEKNTSENKTNKEEEWRKTLVSEFSKELEEQVLKFVASVRHELQARFGLDVTKLFADHVCYRTDNMEQYAELVEALRGSDAFRLLIESEIGGRPIATFKLTRALISDNHPITVIEIPSPKKGSPYPAGLEHVEFVIGSNDEDSSLSPLNSKVHQSAFASWMEKYPAVDWNTKAKDKECNPDISTKMELSDFGTISVKFHLMSLEKVIRFELENEKNKE